LPTPAIGFFSPSPSAWPTSAGPSLCPRLCQRCVVHRVSRFDGRWRELDKRSQWSQPLGSLIKSH